MKKLTLIPILSLCLIACTPNISPDQYCVANVGQSQEVIYGKILKKRCVEVASHPHEENGTMIGTGAGATVGSAIGDNTRANVLGGIGGAVIGGITGHMIGKNLGMQKGMEYIVRLDNGKKISIVQGPQPLLSVGQRVMFMTGGNARDRLVAA